MLIADFKIEIPFLKGGKSSGNSEGNAGGKIRTSIEKLSGSIIKSLGFTKILGDILGDVYNLMAPLIRILSVIAVLIFLPLMPVIKFLAQKLGDFAKMLAGGGTKGIMAYILALLTVIGVALLVAFGGWIIGVLAVIGGLLILAFGTDLVTFIVHAGELIWEVFKLIWELLKFAWEKLMESFKSIWDGLVWVWNLLKSGWQILIDAGKWLWENLIKPGWDFLKDVGEKIWNILKAPFVWLADKVKGIVKLFGGGDGGDGEIQQDFIWRKGQGVTSFSQDDNLIGFKGSPPNLGGSNVTININNPSVRNDQDIKKIANEVSRVIQRNLTGRISSS